jgi:putative colanic acid biosynthesis UDP-glucose lipid carrier transferase
MALRCVVDFHSEHVSTVLEEKCEAPKARSQPIIDEITEPAPSQYPVAKSNFKRALDITVAAMLLLMWLPVILILAIWIKLDSPGPVLFRQRRTGLAGEPFTILKLRTMRVDDDCQSVRHASKDDDRTTRIGAILRRTSIDELPQLVNVLSGDMSLVGPRPHALAHDAFYGARVSDYYLRFRCRPGITGLAQISGFRGEIHELSDMQSRVRTDNAYVENWSIYLDLKILLATVPRMFFDPQAY